MNDVVFALITIAAGALFCFRGHLAFRIVIPVWGTFVGFSFGAGLVASTSDENFLGSATGWVVAIAFAIMFGLLAYLFYEVAVVLAMASIGFTLGASAMVALDVSWTWLVILVGLAAGTALAAAAIATDLPMLLLMMLSALGGASAITAGLLLLVGSIETGEFDDAGVTTRANEPWAYALYLVLAVAGILVQRRAAGRAHGSMRDSWATRRA